MTGSVAWSVVAKLGRLNMTYMSRGTLPANLVQRRSSLVNNTVNIDFSPPGIHGKACKKWKCCPSYWPFVWGIIQSPVNSSDKSKIIQSVYISFVVNLSKLLNKNPNYCKNMSKILASLPLRGWFPYYYHVSNSMETLLLIHNDSLQCIEQEWICQK